MKQQINEIKRMQELAGIKEKNNLEKKAVMTGSPFDGGKDSEGVAYDPYKLEFDIDTCRIIQGRNVIEISRKASKELAKEIRNSFF